MRWTYYLATMLPVPLIPLDYIFWSHLKSLLYEMLVDTVENLTARIVRLQLISPAHWICLNTPDNLSSVSVGFAAANLPSPLRSRNRDSSHQASRFQSSTLQSLAQGRRAARWQELSNCTFVGRRS
ncbi:hypothetical protein TNCV_2872001 [Trichonephila clavipes]|nr:hypothetical protein TNCV_2872001 [Trichonephila clavipes]